MNVEAPRDSLIDRFLPPDCERALERRSDAVLRRRVRSTAVVVAESDPILEIGFDEILGGPVLEEGSELHCRSDDAVNSSRRLRMRISLTRRRTLAPPRQHWAGALFRNCLDAVAIRSLLLDAAVVGQ